MCSNKFIGAFSRYLEQKYGLTITIDLLLQVLYVEKLLKYYGYDTINTDEFFFLLYFIFDHVRHLPKCLAHHHLQLSLFLVYSYFGPSTEYKINLFISRYCNFEKMTINWKKIILQATMDSNLSKSIFEINYNKDIYEMELKRFLAYSA